MKRLGLIVAMLVIAGAAAAAGDKTAKKPTPKSEAADPKTGAKAPADPPAVGSGADGSADADPVAALPPHITGPKLVDLGNDTEIDLPAGMILLEAAEAQALLRKGGNSADNTVAAIIPVDGPWSIVIDFHGEGYVDDSDAKDLDADELLRTFQAGTTQQNERRRAMGVSELILDGWSEPPRYEPVTHHLVWGIKGHSTEGPVINFSTRILGRPGYLSVNLIDGPETIVKSKIEAATILAATRFKAGQRYEDHKSEDKSSGIGLRTLVLGGAGAGVAVAAKAGLIGKLLLLLKGGFKIIILAVGGFFAWIGRGFKRKAKADVMPPSDSPPPSDPTQPPNV